MPIIRAKSHELVVRYAGRRMRVTTQWCDVSEDAIAKVVEDYGDQIEFKPDTPAEATSKPKRPKKSRATKGSEKSSGDDPAETEGA